ncbi:MAG TPA: hypothetical protein ENN30_00325, partial [Candidatus Woesearchaeota archaeon]|nr:hypothetical protein [Candidatus Woesearchaeota archaeon]
IMNLMYNRPEDAFAFMVGDEKEIKQGLEVIIERCKQYLKGVHKEVRQANEDGTTTFLRIMPGAARMYPETDTVPIEITQEIIKKAKVPETPEKRVKKFLKWGLSEDLAGQMLHSDQLIIFEKLAGMFKNVEPTIIANSLLSARDEIKKRHNTDSTQLVEEHFREAFELLNKNKIAKEAVIEILAFLARNPFFSAEQAMKDLKLSKITLTELKKIIQKTLEENKELTQKKQFGILMGLLMRRVRGRIDGELIAKELKKALNQQLFN